MPDISQTERACVLETQCPLNSACLANKVSSPAWTTKPSWFIAVDDRMLPPEYEQAVSKHIRATTTTLRAGHVPMLSKPEEVAAVIIEAASKSVPPLPGVLGQVKAITPNSVDVGTKAGIVSIKISQPLTTYRQGSSDLSQVTSDSDIGVSSEEWPGGTGVATPKPVCS